jgi:hypothetical protein
MYLITQEEEELYPTDLLVLAAARAAAHSQIRSLLSAGNPIWLMSEEEKVLQPTMHVAVPIGEIRALTLDLSRRMVPFIGGLGLEETEVSVDQIASQYEEIFGIHIYPSPPRKLRRILAHIKRDDAVFDIDVDYFQEMQAECYSPKTNARPGDLGRLEETLRLIRKVKPPLITISEATVAARKDSTSMFNQFIEWLRRRDYVVEQSELFEEDSEPRKALRTFEEYWRTVREPLLARTSDLREVDSSEFLDKVRRDTARFFSERAH